MLREHEQCTGRCKQELVSGGEGGCENDGVDDVVENLDTGDLDDNDEWRLSSGTGALLVGLEEVRVGSLNAKTNHEDGENVETDNSVEDCSDGSLHGLSGIAGFQADGGKTFHTTVGERCLSKDSPETEETSLGGRLNTKVVGVERLISPVAETSSVLVWTTSQVDDQAEENEADDSYDFDALWDANGK